MYGDVLFIIKFLETLVVKSEPIVRDNDTRCFESTYDGFSNKVVDILPRHVGQWLGFNPLSEAVDRYQ